jgi:hypothetical protein
MIGYWAMLFRTLRTLIFTFALILAATFGVGAQGTPPPPDEQNETFIDTLKRMQIKREEDEHKKLVEKALQIKEAAENLNKENGGEKSGLHLARAADKKLREIEKSAKQIRSESGGGDDGQQLESPPKTLADALKQLSDASQRLQVSMEKTSRRVVSASVVAETNEIIQLVKIIRGYLN